MSGLTRFFASTVLIFSFFVFVPGGAEARMAATGMEAGAAAGVPLSGLDLGSAMVGAGVIPTRTTLDHITTRFLRSRPAAGHAYAFGATDTGHTAGRGAAGKQKPAVKAGLLRLIQRSALLPFAHVDEVPGDRRRCSHCR